MTNEQLYLLIGIPTLINAGCNAIEKRFESVEKRFDAMLDRWRVDVWKE